MSFLFSRKPKFNITTKITLAFSGLVLVCTALVGYLVFIGNCQVMEKDSRNKLTYANKIIGLQLIASVNRLTDDLRLLASDPSIKFLGSESNSLRDVLTPEKKDELTNQIRKFLQSKLEYYQVSIVGVEYKGKELLKVIQTRENIIIAGQNYLKSRHGEDSFGQALRLQPGQIYVSDIHLKRINDLIMVPHVPAISVSCPIYSAKGKILGVIIIDAELSSIIKDLQKLKDESALLFLANDKGEYLIHPDPEKSFAYEFGKSYKIQDDIAESGEILKGAVSNAEIASVAPIEKDDYMIAYMEKIPLSIDQSRFLLLAIASPHSEFINGAMRVCERSMAIVLLIFGFGIGLTLVFSRFLVQPLRQITKAVSNFGKEDHDVSLPTNREDEIGILARSFDQMSNQIHRQIAELEYKERSISAIIETTIEAILLFNENGEVEKCNHAAEEIFGFGAEDLIGKDFNKIITVGGQQQDEDWFQNFLKSGKENIIGTRREISLQRKDGKTINLIIALSEFSVGGQRKFTGIVHDITERKKAEEELLIAKQSAEKAKKIKEEFLSVISHEIRAPMNAVIGMTRLLLQNEPSQKQLPIINTLKFSADNLMSLINDLLDYSKIEAGKLEFEETDFNLKELINNIVLSHKHKAIEKGVKLQLFIDNNVTEHIKGDPVRLFQILNNLVGNSLKFTEKGNVSLTARAGTYTEEKLNLIFEVSDTGIGIAADKIPLIFERFTQGSSDITRKYGGSGLGLTITKNLVELQGGRIEVDSALGKGSTFRVFLKYKKGEVPKVVPSRSFKSEESLKGLRILYVEDVEYNQFVMNNYLSELKADFEIVSNGKEGVKRASEKKYDLILMDIQMPEMDGYEAAEKIRAMNKHYSGIPIIAVTAMISGPSRERIFACGMNDIILKPVDPDELYRKIASYTNISIAVEDSKQREKTSFRKLEQAYDNDLERLKKPLGILKKEFQDYKISFVSAIQDKNIEKFRNYYHKIYPHIKTLQLTELDEYMISGKKLLSEPFDEPKIAALLENIKAYFDALIAEFEYKLKELDNVNLH